MLIGDFCQHQLHEYINGKCIFFEMEPTIGDEILRQNETSAGFPQTVKQNSLRNISNCSLTGKSKTIFSS